MTNIRLYLVLFACSVAVIGLFGPAAFIESKGALNLYQITYAARSVNMLYPDIYLWLGLFFTVMVLLIAALGLFKKYTIASLFAFVNIMVWSVGVTIFHQLRTRELERLKALGDVTTLDHFANTVFFQGLQLQWGIYLILLSNLLVLLFSLNLIKTGKQ